MPGPSSMAGLKEESPSPEEWVTNTAAFGPLPVTSSLPAPLGWVCLPERKEVPRLLLCSKCAARGAWRPCPGELSTLGAAPPGVCQDSSGHKTSVPPGNAVLGFLPLLGCLQPLLNWGPPQTKGGGPARDSYLWNPQFTCQGVQLSKPVGDSLDSCLGDRKHGQGWKYFMSNFSAQVGCCWDS